MRMTLDELEPIAAALRKNNMKVTCVSNKEEVEPLLKKVLPVGATIGVGGSMSLFQAGVIDLLRSGDYQFLDRYQEGLTPEKLTHILNQSQMADVYVCSSNAVTRNGELYNVDGRANRVSAIAHGPSSVVMIVGCNKIVDDLEDAVHRVKTVAAPLNTKRLGCKTYCAANGACVKADSPLCTDGCQSPERICVQYLVSGRQRIAERIHVILVGESLGF